MLASLLPVPKKYKKDKRAFFHEVGYETSDIDLFLYGLTPTEAKDKVTLYFFFLPYLRFGFFSLLLPPPLFSVY